ncbi:hypothetical protein SAMD00019534_019520, partial [Acytostelium subglobosum LB1]|uniref:hypothetical protein n=1 Tax=Acytostelium subglobosum LB1 TaxID=1410327 RepID=UPI000644D156
MSSHTFDEEIEDAINDVSFGVESVSVLKDHPQSSFSSGIVVLDVKCKEKYTILVKMSMNDGYSVIEHSEPNRMTSRDEDEGPAPPFFDALPNLLMRYSDMYQTEFQNQLFQRLTSLAS